MLCESLEDYWWSGVMDEARLRVATQAGEVEKPVRGLLSTGDAYI
jgi:hypothetical protein